MGTILTRRLIWLWSKRKNIFASLNASPHDEDSAKRDRCKGSSLSEMLHAPAQRNPRWTWKRAKKIEWNKSEKMPRRHAKRRLLTAAVWQRRDGEATKKMRIFWLLASNLGFNGIKCAFVNIEKCDEPNRSWQRSVAAVSRESFAGDETHFERISQLTLKRLLIARENLEK